MHGKRSTVANVAVARELIAFLWAAMTDQPLRGKVSAAACPLCWGGATSATTGRILGPPMRSRLATLSSRQLTTGHCPAVATRAFQSDSRRCRRAGRPTPASTTVKPSRSLDTTTALDSSVHLRRARRVRRALPRQPLCLLAAPLLSCLRTSDFAFETLFSLFSSRELQHAVEHRGARRRGQAERRIDRCVGAVFNAAALNARR
jgi:hypothetical protein